MSETTPAKKAAQKAATKKAPASSDAPGEKKVTKLKIKGVKEPVEVIRTKDTGKAIHHYFIHPDTGAESRVIKLK